MKFKAGDIVSGGVLCSNSGLVLGASGDFVHVRWSDIKYDPHDSGPYGQNYSLEYPEELTLIRSGQNEIATYHQEYAEQIVNDCMDILKDAIQIHSLAVKKDMS